MNRQASEILRRADKSWLSLARTGVWIVAVLSAFLAPPPLGALEETTMWTRFGQFLVAMLAGFAILASLRWQKKSHTFGWAAAAALCLILGCGMLFAYRIYVAKWTEAYAGRQVVVGGTNDFTAAFLDRLKQGVDTVEDLNQAIMRAGGNRTLIWKKDAIIQREIPLSAIYVCSVALFTICIMAIAQAIHCAAAQPKPRKRTTVAAVQAAPPDSVEK